MAQLKGHIQTFEDGWHWHESIGEYQRYVENNHRAVCMHRSYADDEGVQWVKQIIPGVECIPTRVHIPYKYSVATYSSIIPGLGSSSDEYSDEDVRMENNGVVKGTKAGHVPPKYAKNSPDIAAGRGKNESTCKKDSPKGRKSNTSCN